MNLATRLNKAVLRCGFAESITYDPGGAANKVIPAVINRDDSFRDEINGFNLLIYRASVTISTDATDGIANPSHSKTVNFDGQTWAIDSIQLDGSAGATLTVERTEQV